MSRYIRPRALVTTMLLIALAAFIGCSDNPVSDTSSTDDTGLVNGGVDLAAGDFELTVATAVGTDRALQGPFAIRGRNIHYDDTLGALVADLTVVNRSGASYPEPVGLTFVRLLPEGVEVLNPDNDVHGEGAHIRFDFANDDAMWTPREESLPREVQFKAERGKAVAFVARIDVGVLPAGGAIGGLVWNDVDKDGHPDPDEHGIAGAEVVLMSDAATTANAAVLRRTLTNEKGLYRFGNLRAGLYTVHKPPVRGCEPTTPTEVHVILHDTDGNPVEFFNANFGCFLLASPPPPDSAFVEVGDWVEASGEYIAPDPTTRPIGLAARSLDVKDCDPRPGPVTVVSTDDCAGLPQELRGPVTGIALDRRALRVMDTWLHVPPDSLLDPATDIRLMIPLDEIELGDRVRAVVHQPGGPLPLTATELAWWNEDADMILGFVDHVDYGDEGKPVRLLVLGTQIGIGVLTDAP